VPDTLELLERKLRTDSSLKERTHHTVETTLKLVKLSVENTYLQFGKKFYQHTCGMAMGSPLSPVLCNMYMEDLEEKAMSTFHVKLHIILRYMDDMFYEWPEDVCLVTDFFRLSEPAVSTYKIYNGNRKRRYFTVSRRHSN
jgi:hypothetical protein